MASPTHIIAALLVKRLQDQPLDPTEDTLLRDWASQDPVNAQFVSVALNEEQIIQWLIVHDIDLRSGVDKNVLSRIKERIVFEPEARSIPVPSPVQRVHFLNTGWFRVAAAVILFLGVGGYFMLRDRLHQPVLTQTTKPAIQQDILPGTNKATLVLGDESIIVLDTASNGLLTTQGGSEIIKTDEGEIVYAGGATNNNTSVYYQKLITPRGGQYQVTLPDGTQAWLNAESSIRFPNLFNGATRTVEITGEVYFEVKANKSTPFIVKTIKDEITVMGTRFNVSGYANELMKTSLIDGAVKINQTILQPGNAYVNGKIIATDIQQDIAWKNGYFNFNNLDLPTAMQEIARWYDVHIIYAGKIPPVRFGGKMQRDLSLQQMLKALGAMGVRFSLDGRNLTVKP